MKYNIKIGITPAKLCYSICFALLLALIRGVSSEKEIGAAMDANIALLAMIFCADTYYQEIQSDRWEVFYLVPPRSRYLTICQRLFAELIYLALLTVICYLAFYARFSGNFIQSSEIPIDITAILACCASVFFFGTFTFTLVNVFGNLWAGIGGALLVWSVLNSALGRKLPAFINVFAYGNYTEDSSREWIAGKLTAVVLSGLLILINYKLLNRQERIR